MIYTLINGGVVRNIIIAESSFLQVIENDWDDIVDITNLSPKPHIGDLYSGSVFTRPVLVGKVDDDQIEADMAHGQKCVKLFISYVKNNPQAGILTLLNLMSNVVSLLNVGLLNIAANQLTGLSANAILDAAYVPRYSDTGLPSVSGLTVRERFARFIRTGT